MLTLQENKEKITEKKPNNIHISTTHNEKKVHFNYKQNTMISLCTLPCLNNKVVQLMYAKLVKMYNEIENSLFL